MVNNQSVFCCCCCSILKINTKTIQSINQSIRRRKNPRIRFFCVIYYYWIDQMMLILSTTCWSLREKKTLSSTRTDEEKKTINSPPMIDEFWTFPKKQKLTFSFFCIKFVNPGNNPDFFKKKNCYNNWWILIRNSSIFFFLLLWISLTIIYATITILGANLLLTTMFRIHHYHQIFSFQFSVSMCDGHQQSIQFIHSFIWLTLEWTFTIRFMRASFVNTPFDFVFFCFFKINSFNIFILIITSFNNLSTHIWLRILDHNTSSLTQKHKHIITTKTTTKFIPLVFLFCFVCSIHLLDQVFFICFHFWLFGFLNLLSSKFSLLFFLLGCYSNKKKIRCFFLKIFVCSLCN